MFAQIKADGYGGGYSQLTAFIRDLRGRQGKQPHAFVPLQFELAKPFNLTGVKKAWSLAVSTAVCRFRT